jgi:serine/threonine-protein phosphatase 2A regulatory subunit A
VLLLPSFSSDVDSSDCGLATRHLQATDSITNIAGVLSQSQVEHYYVPLMKRLSQGDWFTARASSAALFHPVYDKVSSALQDDMRKGFTTLGSDDTPMVRRAAAKHLGVRHPPNQLPLAH